VFPGGPTLGNYRQLRRNYEEIPFHPSSYLLRENMREYFATHESPDWAELDARLQAFASEPVFTAVQASSTAHNAAMEMIRARQGLDMPDNSGDEDRAKAERLFAAVALDAEKKREAAEAADDAVIELIRIELQGRGRPLGDWKPVVPAYLSSGSPRREDP
jgi:hypothetical protein